LQNAIAPLSVWNAIFISPDEQSVGCIPRESIH
jgi:hypothetical protein